MITREEYEALLADRPRKASPEQVGWVDESDSAHTCCGCIHWFHNPARGTAVCEILRFPDERDVAPLGRCQFWTPDGRWYPLLEDAPDPTPDPK